MKMFFNLYHTPVRDLNQPIEWYYANEGSIVLIVNGNACSGVRREIAIRTISYGRPVYVDWSDVTMWLDIWRGKIEVRILGTAFIGSKYIGTCCVLDKLFLHLWYFFRKRLYWVGKNSPDDNRGCVLGGKRRRERYLVCGELRLGFEFCQLYAEHGIIFGCSFWL